MFDLRTMLSMFRLLLLLILIAGLGSSCRRASTQIEPMICQPPHPKELHREKRFFLCLPQDFSVSPFPPLTSEELSQDWAKEYRIALAFAEDFDLYRAITGFKRALCLMPEGHLERRLEIEYAIALGYFLGKKYVEVVYSVESTGLVCIDETFPAYSDLLLILYDSYVQLNRDRHAQHILKLIEDKDPAKAKKLALLEAVKQAEFERVCDDGYEKVISGYQKEAKSVRRAELLNAFLPGAGYWYVGLKQTAVTALLINSLFIAAGAHFIHNGNNAAAAITLSLEGGWYFGGIYGAGLAAKYYNERLYCKYADKITQREQLFPIMMLNYTF